MNAREINRARIDFGLGRRDFGRLIGYTGDPRNIWVSVKRMETGEREVPPTVARMVRLLIWFKEDYGYVPDVGAGSREALVISEDVDD